MRGLACENSMIHPISHSIISPNQQKFETDSLLKMTMEIVEYLQNAANPCPLPRWLEFWTPDSSFDIDAFLSSDVVFYPGGRTDGQPIRLFNVGCSASCYLYSDYLERVLEDTNLEFSIRPLKGYSLLETRDVVFEQVFKKSLGDIIRYRMGKERVYDAKDKIGRLYIFRRDEMIGKGSPFLALLYLTIDAYYVFQKLFSEKVPPLGILLAQHGFSGNYDSFGGGGLLEEISTSQRIIPKWLLVAKGTPPWRMFHRVPEVSGDTGGMHKDRRYLYSNSKRIGV